MSEIQELINGIQNNVVALNNVSDKNLEVVNHGSANAKVRDWFKVSIKGEINFMQVSKVKYRKQSI